MSMVKPMRAFQWAARRAMESCIAEDAEHELGEMIGGEGGCEALQPVGHEADWHPEAAEEGHGQIDEVDDAGGGVGWDEQREEEAHAGEADAADYGHAEHLDDFGGGERDAAECYARWTVSDGDDDEAEGDGAGALCEEIGGAGMGLARLSSSHPAASSAARPTPMPKSAAPISPKQA